MFEYLGPASAGLFIVWVSIIVIAEWLIPIPTRFHPLWILNQSAKLMAKKVHPNLNRSRSQQRISGLMATLLLWFLIVGSISIFYAVADLKQILSLALLYVLLGSQPWRQERRLILYASSHNMLRISRSRLGKWLNRDCEKLTEFGIQKAVFEQSINNQFHGWIGTLFWFVVLGPIGALNFRLLYELSRAWPQRLPGWHDFGFVSAQLFRIFNSIPNFLFRILLALFAWASKRNVKPIQVKSAEHSVLAAQEQKTLAAIASVSDAPVGGPIKYQDTTITRRRWGTQKLRNQKNCNSIFRHFTLLQLTWLILLLSAGTSVQLLISA